MNIQIHEYASDIKLFEYFHKDCRSLSAIENEDIINILLNELEPVSKQLGKIEAKSIQEKRKLLHATLNILEPNFLNKKNVMALNSLLQSELQEKAIIKPEDLSVKKSIKGTQISLYQGDITTLKIDAIVNAANSQLLGCFQPLHSCIDNAIHSKAGVQLRDDCQIIINKQESLETTGEAKITRAYNLPSKFVIHTVGPIVQGKLNSKHEESLIKSYTSCLDICKEISAIKSIAFCCISTGAFGYPPEQAAQTAYDTIFDWLEKNPNQLDQVVLNVFTDNDLRIYDSLMQ